MQYVWKCKYFPNNIPKIILGGVKQSKNFKNPYFFIFSKKLLSPYFGYERIFGVHICIIIIHSFITHRYVQVGKSHYIYKIYFSTNQKTISYFWNNFIFLNSFRYNYQNSKPNARVFGKYAAPGLSSMWLTTSGLFMLHTR